MMYQVLILIFYVFVTTNVIFFMNVILLMNIVVLLLVCYSGLISGLHVTRVVMNVVIRIYILILLGLNE